MKNKNAARGSLRGLVRPSTKTHHFVLGVKTNGTRKDAERAVLSSFKPQNDKISHEPNK